jgi:sugar/nucleoside kinase (ribokinase family)
LALQGFKVAYCGKVGHDKEGDQILKELKERKIDVSMCLRDKEYSTAYSAILSLPEEERTVLIYRGACHFLKEAQLPKAKILKTKWFYLAPLSGQTANLFESLLAWGLEHKIKVAVNLSLEQINWGFSRLKPLLKLIDLLILNQEEAALLVGKTVQDEKETMRELSRHTNGLVIITKGGEGSLVSDGKIIFQAGALDQKVVEKTGAGDAFAAGFLAGLLKQNTIEYAIQLATANATSCMLKVGAKNGLLTRDSFSQWPKVKINQYKIESF